MHACIHNRHSNKPNSCDSRVTKSTLITWATQPGSWREGRRIFQVAACLVVECRWSVISPTILPTLVPSFSSRDVSLCRCHRLAVPHRCVLLRTPPPQICLSKSQFAVTVSEPQPSSSAAVLHWQWCVSRRYHEVSAATMLRYYLYISVACLDARAVTTRTLVITFAEHVILRNTVRRRQQIVHKHIHDDINGDVYTHKTSHSMSSGSPILIQVILFISPCDASSRCHPCPQPIGPAHVPRDWALVGSNADSFQYINKLINKLLY